MNDIVKQIASLPPETISFIEAAPDLYLILSPDLYIITATRSYLQATDRVMHDIKGKFVFDVFPDNPILPESDSTSNLRSSLERVLSHRESHQMALQRYDVPHPSLPGVFRERYWLPTNTPVLDADGQVQYIIHKVVDVTEQLATQQQLHHLELLRETPQTGSAGNGSGTVEDLLSQKNLYHIFMQTPALICIMEGPQHVLKLFNPPYKRMLGNRPLLGLPAAEALPELAAQGLIDLMDQVYQSGQSVYVQEMKVQLAHENNGKLRNNYYNFTYQAIRNQDGEVYGVLLFAHEVTAMVQARHEVERREKVLQTLNEQLEAANGKIKAANDDLSKAQHELQELNLALEERIAERTHELAVSNRELQTAVEQLRHINIDLDNFIYTASHDLKAPIANIEGLMHLLFDVLPPQVLADLKLENISGLIYHSISRFNRTIGHLTEVVELQKEHKQAPVLVDLGTVIQHIQFDLALEIKAANAHVEVDIADCPHARFSEKNMRSVIYNLMSNAIKYRSPERSLVIHISCRKVDDCVALSVRDNGLGLETPSNRKLFAMFTRLHDHVDGSGIGLYMVRRIVENAGGRIEVESQLGEGSVFTVYLPQASH